MKKYLLILTLLLINKVFAQQENRMTKNTSGRYVQGSQNGIYIYDDGSFALFGYATLVLGKYTLSNNQINFIPDIPKQVFTVLGRKNTAVKSGVKLTFASGFLNDGPTYIKFDDDSLMNTFEEDYDGGEPYYVIELARSPKTLTLAQNTINHLYQNNTNIFNLDHHFNDFLLFHHKTVGEQKPFSATFKTENGKTILQSRWGDFKKNETGADAEFDTFISNYKKQQQKGKEAKEFYFNNELKTANGFNYLSEAFSVFDINNYILDESSNKFIRKDIYKKGTDYTNAVAADYHDESYLLKYDDIKVVEQTLTDFGKVKIGPKALFKKAGLNQNGNGSQKEKKSTLPLITEPLKTLDTQYPTKAEPVKIETPKIKKKN
ncbi:hypothetical protein [Pedobacter sp. KBS0701]|uniref:hypothetical protein n=1 Tax=unclassified Pedobacter TaxID=2628915 RepID=UPI00110EC43F|nr:hypothetical protein [Pedobacter sp. KBS0701]QDW24821.1 hypothetical protein FFJ24_008350 [Pedobacter sp. KBS0701]